MKRTAAWAVPVVSAVTTAALTVGLAAVFRPKVAPLEKAVRELGTAHATDHADGDFVAKTADVDITDHFAFREDTATDASGDEANIVFGQLTNPTIADLTDVPFNTEALYEIHVSRVEKADREAQPSGNDDVVFQFQFTGKTVPQTVKLTVLDEGTAIYSGGNYQTTTAANAATPTENTAVTAKGSLTFFAGMRKDPAVFDKDRFQAVRTYALSRWIDGSAASLANTCDAATAPVTAGSNANFFNPTACATNTLASKNVNAIVIRVPITFLRSTTTQTVFDSWSTTSLPTAKVQGLENAM